jgi:hypothetical protein
MPSDFLRAIVLMLYGNLIGFMLLDHFDSMFKAFRAFSLLACGGWHGLPFFVHMSDVYIFDSLNIKGSLL